MCCESKPIRCLTLFEGWVKWIRELDTAEERLAAWETFGAIAFPEDESRPYEPPPLPTNGSKLSVCDKVRRQVYNLFKAVIESNAIKNSWKGKDQKKVEAGRLGAAIRFGRNGESSTVVTSSEPEVGAKPTSLDVTRQEEAIVNRSYTPRRRLTADDKEKIAEWNRTIPNASALQEYLRRNYMYQNTALILTPEFCEFAYHKLANIDKWISTRDKKPFNDIRNAIHYLALDYIKKSGEIRRAEKEEKRLDMEADFEMQTTLHSKQSPSDIAEKERKRRMDAEQKAMEMILKGEL